MTDVWGTLNLVSQNFALCKQLDFAMGSTFNKKTPGSEQIWRGECVHGTNALARGCGQCIPLDIYGSGGLRAALILRVLASLVTQICQDLHQIES